MAHLLHDTAPHKQELPWPMRELGSETQKWLRPEALPEYSGSTLYWCLHRQYIRSSPNNGLQLNHHSWVPDPCQAPTPATPALQQSSTQNKGSRSQEESSAARENGSSGLKWNLSGQEQPLLALIQAVHQKQSRSLTLARPPQPVSHPCQAPKLAPLASALLPLE